LQIKIDNLNSEIDLKNNEITKKTNEITNSTNAISDIQINLDNQTKENTTSRLQLEKLKEYINHIIKSMSQSTMIMLNDSE
jgi:regulator of replication initiation timing